MRPDVAVRLIAPGVSDEQSQTWVDLGAGSGTFTVALASLLKQGSQLYAVDRDAVSLQKIVLPDTRVSFHTIVQDFTHASLPVKNPDGVLMANALHYVKEQAAFLAQLRRQLSPRGRIILVEYDTSNANRWVPYPVKFTRLQPIAQEAGFKTIEKLNETPSVYQTDMMYAALLS